MKIIHRPSGSVTGNALADDLPWQIMSISTGGVVLKVRGGKYRDIRYEVILDEHDLTKLSDHLTTRLDG